jgi:uncharacterized protein YecT (DUF1311 family)
MLNKPKRWPTPEPRFKNAELKLNATHQEVLKIYPKKYLAAFKKASVAWLDFRDLEAAARSALYPEGERAAMVLAIKANLDTLRVVELRQWLEGAEEGDVCSGTFRRGK